MYSNYVLPPVKEGSSIELLHFPTAMQTFVFRNWELVSAKRIAEVLETDEATVKQLAFDMGLPEQKDVSVWLQRGYITVIKQNWHILPYNQLLKLLGWNEEELAYVLKEDDFLSIKLGRFKFDCEPIKYQPLNDEQKEQTKEIAQIVKSIWKESDCDAFDFFSNNDTIATENNKNAEGALINDGWCIVDQSGFERATVFANFFSGIVEKSWGIKLCGNDKKIILKKENLDDNEETHKIIVTTDSITICANAEVGLLRGLMWLCDKMDEQGAPVIPLGTQVRHPKLRIRYIYSYHSLYGNVFDEEPDVSFSDELLAQYARLGINGVWMQGVLYKLVKFPFAPEISDGYEKRMENLRRIIAKAANYGIKVYLYINEPRSMPLSFFDKHPELKGEVRGKSAMLCTSTQQIKDYLHYAITTLCENAAGIGGFFTITASENMTNCYSRCFPGESIECPRCKERTPADVVSEVNRIIYEAATAVDPKINLIAWSWSWRIIEGLDVADCIARTPKGVSIMSNSEERLKYSIAGVENEVEDYTMSLPAPSETAKNTWKLIKDTGHKVAAKIQINNTWECSAVPYIPVFGLVSGHIERLLAAGVDDIMLSWTLGGAPSPNIKIASSYFFDGDDNMDMLKTLYGKNADIVRKATDIMGEAFKEYPFSVQTVYAGPMFTGPANLMFSKPSGLKATMTGYPYDTVEKWCGPFTPEILESQFEKLSVKWYEGIKLLSAMPDSEVTNVATACYDIFRSVYNQIKYIRLRQQNAYKEMIEVLKEEEQLAISLYEISLKHRTVGFEASNHYVFTPYMFIEKVLNCRRLIKEFENK